MANTHRVKKSAKIRSLVKPHKARHAKRREGYQRKKVSKAGESYYYYYRPVVDKLAGLTPETKQSIRRIRNFGKKRAGQTFGQYPERGLALLVKLSLNGNSTVREIAAVFGVSSTVAHRWVRAVWHLQRHCFLFWKTK